MAAPSLLPPGFRFHPTDEELVAYYLTRKCSAQQFRTDAIAELDLYKHEPWHLAGLSLLPSRDHQWYFFNLRDKKYPHSDRSNRSTGVGFWKATGKDRPVLSGTRKIGLKKTLVFYIGRAPHGERTDWVMHEYRLDKDYEKGQAIVGNYVVCRIYKKGGPGPRNGEQYGAPVDEGYDFVELASSDGVAMNEQGPLAHWPNELQLPPNNSFILKRTPAKISSFPEVMINQTDDKPANNFPENLHGFPNELFDLQDGKHAALEPSVQNMDLKLQKEPVFHEEAKNFQISNDSPFMSKLDETDNILWSFANEKEMLEELLLRAENNSCLDLELAMEEKVAHSPEPRKLDEIVEGDFLEFADLGIPFEEPLLTLLCGEEWPVPWEQKQLGLLSGETEIFSRGFILDGQLATRDPLTIVDGTINGSLLHKAPDISESNKSSHPAGNVASCASIVSEQNPSLEVRTVINESFKMPFDSKLPLLPLNFDEAPMQRKDRELRENLCCASNIHTPAATSALL